ncbi:IclR family transcriptional regulator [Haloplanus aerogenes]|uniref:IclR family transcriptional regulator n=1 Tax=Haloplanus aerogenes TaxID=660522 RepID=A0A3M0CX29_9EURY|nr:IclR family transcriptional regulator [Haloplanus aerogenes]AZH24821.1 IclR family transcriptional regulator [Haloplanus aerogenes]RMB08363.1 IclR family transcriptional regulator [Haloplanus aerogenes]
MNDNRARPVKTTQTSIRIGREIQRRDGATLTELAAALDLAKSTVHNHLATLVHEGLLVEERGEYHIGLRFLEFGEHARNRREDYTPAKIQVYRLAESTNEEANFAVAENGYMYSIEYVMGDANPNNPAVGSTFLKVGSKFRMHNSAPGKAVLSELPTERVEEILDRRGLPATTDSTITDRETLLAELDTVREQGYATNDEELEVGFRSIAAPVTLDDGTVLGGLSIGGPAYRFELDEASVGRSVDILQNAVENVEREISQLASSDGA